MDSNKNTEDRIKQKLDGLKKRAAELENLTDTELTKKLWELEREAALLREFIENNESEESYKDVG